MIVIGTDTHQRTHALSAVDEGTGKVRGSCQIDADEPGQPAGVKWARGLDDQRVWAIEDCWQARSNLSRCGRRSDRSMPNSAIASARGEHWNEKCR